MINDVYRNYYTRPGGLMQELGEEAPAPVDALRQMHGETMKEGVLDRKTKELVALGIALAVHCDQSAAFHLQDAFDAGATCEEVLEIVGVAALMGGEPAAIHGARLLQDIRPKRATEEAAAFAQHQPEAKGHAPHGSTFAFEGKSA